MKPIVSSYCVHYGEEPVLVGDEKLNSENGVGNIFFGNCNLRCIYCQNHQISQNYSNEDKYEINIEKLSDIMIELQNKKVNSIGLVSPTHFIPQIISALEIAINKGLFLPLIYNTNSYDSVKIISLLNGIVDIYLPDIKYSNDKYAKQYSNADEYYENAKDNIREMYAQVGSGLIIENGVLKRGLIIRHLVLPNDLAGSYEILKFISELDKNITISVMSQFNPVHKSKRYDLLSRTITSREYYKVFDWMEKLGLENGFIQDFDSKEYYIPDFENRKQPFIR
jgi:putative pyruvate formate lyase activating enzyme